MAGPKQPWDSYDLLLLQNMEGKQALGDNGVASL